MAQLPPHSNPLKRRAELRSRAATQLTGSTKLKGPKGDSDRPADALAVLYALASDPVTAADALTLLHELQVHQVELDLQAQELQEARTILEAALRRQIELYDHQPVGCFTLDARLLLHELNLTGAEMLGVARADAYGLPLDAFLCDQSARRCRAALARLTPHAPLTRCRLLLRPHHGPDLPVLASLGVDPAGPQFLLSLTPDAASDASWGDPATDPDPGLKW